MAAAKAPQVLAPRRRKAVNYNEAKLHRKYASASESEQTAAKADTDGDSSEAEDGAEVKVGSRSELIVPLRPLKPPSPGRSYAFR